MSTNEQGKKAGKPAQGMTELEREIRDRIAAEIQAAHQRATYDPHGREDGCEDCNIWYAAYDIAKGERE